MKRNVIVIVGPTSSGKSALAVRLARKLGGEIISADSRQVYRGLNIGTGKITKKEMQGVRHHLLDVASPRSVFTAHDFVRLGRKAIEEIAARGKLPIVCGGTGFYIDALLGRVKLADVPADQKLRTRLENKSTEQLFRILQKRDARRARAIDRRNRVRLIRAIEVAKHSPTIRARGREFLSYSDRISYDIAWIGLRPKKAELRERIRARLLGRMRRGMVAEAKRLHAQGLSYRRMEELGLEYLYLALHLQGKLSREDMLKEIEAKTWQYAKRQMTYWRRNREIR